MKVNLFNSYKCIKLSTIDYQFMYFTQWENICNHVKHIYVKAVNIYFLRCSGRKIIPVTTIGQINIF